MGIRTITNYNLPDGRRIQADAEDMVGTVSYYAHNPDKAKEEIAQHQLELEAQQLMNKHAMGMKLSEEQLDLIYQVYPQAFETKPEPKPKRKRKPTKPDLKVEQANKNDLRKRNIK